jgi:hypothetical protein
MDPRLMAASTPNGKLTNLLREEIDGRAFAADRIAELALTEILQPQQVLDRDRAIEPHFVAERFELFLVLGAGRFASHPHRGRIAGRHANQRKDDDRHEEDGGNRLRAPPQRVAGHGRAPDRSSEPRPSSAGRHGEFP